MSAALMLATAMHLAFAIAGQSRLSLLPALGLEIGGMVLFADRYRYFWKVFSEAVVRGIEMAPPVTPVESQSLGAVNHGEPDRTPGAGSATG